MKHSVTIGKARLVQLYGPVGIALGVSATSTFRDICAWCDANLAGSYCMDNIRTWRFDLREDAVMFELTWC